MEIEQLRDARTLLPTEKYVASRIRDRVMRTASAINVDAIRDIAIRRQSDWANSKLPSTADAPRAALSQVYAALMAASSS